MGDSQETQLQSIKPLEVRDGRVSRRLAITLDLETVLSAGGEEFGGVSAGVLTHDSRGRYYLVNDYVRWKVLVFDGHGRYVTAFGSNGQGPGEFTAVRAIYVGRGDTLHIFDYDGRYLVYSPSLQHVRTIGTRTRYTYGFVELKPGSNVVSPEQRLRPGPGYPFYHLSDTERGADFGMTEIAKGVPSESGYLHRVLVRESDSTFWAAHVYRYTVDLWHQNGTLLKRLDRHATWFDVKPITSLEGRANPTVLCISRDNAGRIWLVIRVRDPQFAERFEFYGPADRLFGIRNIRPKSGNIQDIFSAYDAVIEVIDTRRNEAVAALRVDEDIYGCPDQSSVYTVQRAEDGTVRLLVWRLRLQPPRQRRR